MEVMIKLRVVSFLTANSLINNRQHGFLSRRSTTTQLLHCLDTWTKWNRDCSSGFAVYIDFAKAFDTVSHPKLLHKLRGYGISGSLLNWIGAYLDGRFQRVRVNSSYSSWQTVGSGVPQGSVLGPLLFLIYINGLCDVLPPNVDARLFADDVKLFAAVQYTSALQCALNKLSDWATLWQLVVSIPKCFVLPVCSPQTLASPSFSIGGIVLAVVGECQDLGVVVSSDLRFSTHCRQTARKASKVLAVLFRCFRTADLQAHVKGFVSFVRPILEYASQVWSPHLASDSDVIEIRKCTENLYPSTVLEMWSGR